MSDCLDIFFYGLGEDGEKLVEIAGECTCESPWHGGQRETWLVPRHVLTEERKIILNPNTTWALLDLGYAGAHPAYPLATPLGHECRSTMAKHGACLDPDPCKHTHSVVVDDVMRASCIANHTNTLCRRPTRADTVPCEGAATPGQ